MSTLYDIAHIWGQDIRVTATGDIAVSSTRQRTVERIVRRLMTAATSAADSDYPWQPGYGIGLGKRVGDQLDIRAIQGLVRSQVLLERSVARSPQPIITVTELATGGASIDINYTDTSGSPSNFSFSLGEISLPGGS